MNIKAIMAIAAILVLLGAGYAAARSADGGMMGGYGGRMGNANYGGMMQGYGHGFWNNTTSMMGSFENMMGYYGHMMRNYGNGLWHGMMGGYRGIMGGYGGMMGGSNGYCGGYGSGGYGINANPNVTANATPITIENAKEDVENYLASTGNKDLKLSEIIEFDNHFYAGVKEKNTGKHAFELLVNKYTGAIAPEMGPNMMWNTKYGHMNWNTPEQTIVTVTEEQALKNAQAYLDKALPGTKTGDADAFYGYYTIEVLKNGNIYGMLSVNSNTGAVWYHNWHGEFVKILEVE